MLEVSHVSKKYRGCQQALEDVSLSVGPVSYTHLRAHET